MPLESEVFLLGMWNNYSDLEDSLSMPELLEILVASRKKAHQDRKFLAALQGHDLGGDPEDSQDRPTFEDLKARAFSGGQAKDAKDILSMQGINAVQAGFGIGMGLDYVDAKAQEDPSW